MEAFYSRTQEVIATVNTCKMERGHNGLCPFFYKLCIPPFYRVEKNNIMHNTLKKTIFCDPGISFRKEFSFHEEIHSPLFYFLFK